jgi:acyl-CoA thioester hydrolase
MTDADADAVDHGAAARSDDPFVADLDVRFRDLDPMGHVNNAVYVSYLEQARLEYFESVLGLDATDPGNVVASLDVDYRRSLELDADLRVAVWTERLGESSLEMRYEVRDDGRVAAEATTTQVVVDGEGRPRPIPDEWRERVRSAEGDRLADR